MAFRTLSQPQRDHHELHAEKMRLCQSLAMRREEK